MILRPNYISEITKFKDVKLVKILSGIRRCGKSTILDMVKMEYRNKGVKNDHIISRKYSKVDIDDGFNYKDMYKDIISSISDSDRYYIFLDEVQEVTNWEKTVNTLLEDYNTDIYITGSNSKLMASEISTYLSGRYVQIPVYNLSFEEFLKFKENDLLSNKDMFEKYLKNGGFPLVSINDYDEQTNYQIVEDIYNSVVKKDIVERHRISNIDLFNRVVKFVFENVGKTFSANTIIKYLKSENRSLSVEDIYNYLEWLEQAFIVYRCSRYNLQGKSVLKTQEKFYLADSALKYSLFGFDPKSVSSMLENIVYLELKRRGYEVYVGKYYTKEIDFVAIKRDQKIYIQVCRNLPEDSDREISNLLDIKDSYPKYVVSLDSLAEGNENGVKIINICDFLLQKEL